MKSRPRHKTTTRMKTPEEDAMGKEKKAKEEAKDVAVMDVAAYEVVNREHMTKIPIVLKELPTG